jgi:hypothetical protein
MRRWEVWESIVAIRRAMRLVICGDQEGHFPSGRVGLNDGIVFDDESRP